MIGRQWRYVRVAVQFLTRIPVGEIRGFDPEDITRSARYFPLVGQGVGALSAAALLAASALWGAGWIPALLALAVGILLTGAFHEDGLADTADGLGGGQTPARRLEIMRDSRVGTYGVIALGLVLALKAAALAQTPPLVAALALISVHGLGRGAAVLAMRLSPYAPDATGGKWKPTPQGVSRGEVLGAVLLSVWPLPFLAGVVGLAGPGAAVLTGLVLAALLLGLARRLIGGHTGDVLGAVEQLFETGFLLALAASLS